MDDEKQKYYDQMIKDLCMIIENQEKEEDKLLEIIKELTEENVKLRRKKSLFFRLFF